MAMPTLSEPTLGLLVQVAADTYTLKELKTMMLRADLAQERYGGADYSRHDLVRDRLLRARTLASQGDRDAHRALLAFVRVPGPADGS